MSRGAGLTRRELLRGRVEREQPSPPTCGPEPGKAAAPPLPSVIAWLDPDLKAREAEARREGHGNRYAPALLLRPPGALAEPDFLRACTRCGDCSEACPHDAIRMAAPRLREAAGTPVLEPHEAPCLLCEDLPCVAACEPGALRDDALAVLGTARVSALDCLNRLGSPCSVCVERCPVPDAISFRGNVPEVEESLCTGCGQCQHACPAPQNAILLLPNTRRPGLVELTRAKQDDG